MPETSKNHAKSWSVNPEANLAEAIFVASGLPQGRRVDREGGIVN